jgi:hypothetical protein
MSARRVAILIPALLMLTLGLTCAFMEYHRGSGPHPRNMAIAIAVIAVGTAITAAVLRGLFKNKKYTQFSAVICFATFCCLVGWWLGVAWLRARCGAWALLEGTVLRSVAATRGLEVREGLPNLTPLTDLLTSEVGNRLVDDYCGCLTSTIINEARKHPPAPDDAWETVGPYTLARRRELWTTRDRAPLLAYAIPEPDNDSSWPLYGAGYLEWVSVPNVREAADLFDLQRYAEDAAALGAPPPVDVVNKARRWLEHQGRN